MGGLINFTPLSFIKRPLIISIFLQLNYCCAALNKMKWCEEVLCGCYGHPTELLYPYLNTITQPWVQNAL